ncbi:hypothetical protein MANES_10G141750v8 [Manihot esculenta]|uniref:Uncharacterized protein n=1 Tax=Manihot esculenta TaxID=3983 RepID=A0ACB7H274_MANES|nr:hypothetical protein MANES_10G141750v8 [Manihot esculenta]
MLTNEDTCEKNKKRIKKLKDSSSHTTNSSSFRSALSLQVSLPSSRVNLSESISSLPKSSTLILNHYSQGHMIFTIAYSEAIFRHNSRPFLHG